jgi:hypothetical protein
MPTRPRTEHRDHPAADPWVQLDSGTIPGGNRELRLMQRGDALSIVLDEAELMTNQLRAPNGRLGHSPAPAFATAPAHAF